MIPIATFSRGVRNGVGLRFDKIYQGVYAYSLILSEIERIAFSPFVFVRVCPYVCIYVCVCVFVLLRLIFVPHKNGLR